MAEPASQPVHRVAVVYHFFPHYRGPVNEELARHGRHTYYWVGDRKSAEGTIKAWDVPADVNFVQTKTWAIKWFCVQPGSILAALNPRYDTIAILSVAWWPTTWLAAIAGRLTGKRVLGWGHGWTRPEKGLQGLVRRIYYRLYHGHMSYGHYGKMLFMQPCGGSWKPERINVIYNSLDADRQRVERAKVTTDEVAALRLKVMGQAERGIALCVSRLIPVRRLDLLIEAAALLKQQGRPVDLLLVGDGPEREPLKKLAAERGVNCVFYGPCYDEAVLSRLIMMSHVMVAPGKVGLTAMHALTYGTPVVTHGNEANQMPEWEAIVPGKTGSTFIDGDVPDLARAIGEWTASPTKDPRVSAACIDIIERFWNPQMQRRCIERFIDGKPADDLFWMKEPLDKGR